MRRVATTIAVVCLVGTLVTACGSDASTPAAPPQPSPPDAVTLQVDTRLLPGADGALYTEGALAEVILRDSAGNPVARETARPPEAIRFPSLAPGTYTLAPALRPCDGNCGYLDGRTAGCRATLDLTADTTVSVRFTVAAPCEIDT